MKPLARFTLCVPFALLTGVAAAAVTTPIPSGDRSQYETRDRALQITPYLWAAGLNGSVSPFRRGPAVDVDKSFSDVMEGFNVGGFLHLWARQDRWVFSGEMMYVDTTDSHASGPLSAMQIPELGVTLPPGASVDARVDSRQFMATLLGGYRLIDSAQYTFDLLGGLRLWHVDNALTVTASHPAIGSVTASHDERFGWVDPLAGARLFVPFTDSLSLQAQADIGGAGVGSAYTWSAFTTLSYTVTDNLSVAAGYKALKVDYDRRGHVYDVLLSGPVLGITWRF